MGRIDFRVMIDANTKSPDVKKIVCVAGRYFGKKRNLRKIRRIPQPKPNRNHLP